MTRDAQLPPDDGDGSMWIFPDENGTPETAVDPQAFRKAAVDLAKAIAGTTHDQHAVNLLIAETMTATSVPVRAQLMAGTLAELAGILEIVLEGADPQIRAVIVRAAADHAARGGL